MIELNLLDKKLLQKLQEGLPLESNPFAAIAKDLGISEDEVIARTKKLKEDKIIRRLGGVWNTPRLGFTSMLVALKVKSGHIEDIASRINKHPGVTHNYLRDHQFNVWFTISGESEAEIKAFLKDIAALEGVETILELPAERRFKVEVKFKLEGNEDA